jgi:TonB family protein
MIKALFLAAWLTQAALALSTLSGSVQDTAKAPIDGADVSIWDAATGKGLRTSTAQGRFALTGLAAGDYLFKVEGPGRLTAVGALRLAADESHEINVVMLTAGSGRAPVAGAGSALRDAVRPPKGSTKPKVRPAQAKTKAAPTYPEAERKNRIGGRVTIAMLILPDGSVNDLVVLSAPNSNLAVAARKAVRRWQYSPTYLNDKPVEANLTVDVTFQIR